MTAPPRVQLAQALGDQSGDKRLEILRLVGESGSISEAGRRAGVSYKAAWQAVDTLSNLAGTDLVERAVGGTGGGGARLSAAGRQLLHAADLMAAARQRVLAELAQAPHGQATPAGWEALGLRTSMRNQLPCVVAAMRPERGAVGVRLHTPDGAVLGSRVTRESVQLLGLARGLPVLALFKATAVQILPAPAAPAAAGSTELAGEVLRVGRRSGGGGEIALHLPGGLRVVGFGDAAVAWRVGGAALARLDASAVVIALRG